MKKLMAIAACVFGTAAFAGDSSVTSANIVGFTTTDTTMNRMDIGGADFVSVGATELDIQEIALEGDNEDGCSWLQWWVPSTYKYERAYYVDKFEISGVEQEDGGWASEIFVPVTKKFLPAQGFWFQSAVDAKLRLSGQVYNSTDANIARELTSGKIDLFSNPFPAELKVTSIKFTGANANEAWIQIYNPTTRTYVKYTWDGSKFVDDSSVAVADTVVLAVGQGFWAQATGASTLYITFPNPFHD